ncbi:hypothetical protein PGT21_007508 [Puccinia graminis f. sp. tritici]|uniref:Uncharacterized protein n=1 Tax=Puccinia graminis f. sp. tritici TaxID=56615 RepID=A0A5B0NIG1_PUCGR|nr:hypothetical protein PGT21_007508 [Puccinia graminis f. sp. tritici]KAA1128879.1 hypothetical protein PGTUg99_028575 [Puccinia graminis f. sp. tritici]
MWPQALMMISMLIGLGTALTLCDECNNIATYTRERDCSRQLICRACRRSFGGCWGWDVGTYPSCLCGKVGPTRWPLQGRCQRTHVFTFCNQHAAYSAY